MFRIPSSLANIHLNPSLKAKTPVILGIAAGGASFTASLRSRSNSDRFINAGVPVAALGSALILKSSPGIGVSLGTVIGTLLGVPGAAIVDSIWGAKPAHTETITVNLANTQDNGSSDNTEPDIEVESRDTDQDGSEEIIIDVDQG